MDSTGRYPTTAEEVELLQVGQMFSVPRSGRLIGTVPLVTDLVAHGYSGWIEFIDPAGELPRWYTTEVDGHGRSTSQRPPDAPIAATVYAPTRNHLAQALVELQETLAGTPVARSIAGTLDASKPAYNSEVFYVTRSRLFECDSADAFLMVVEGFIERGDLVARRRRYTADMHLFAGLATALSLGRLIVSRRPDALDACLDCFRQDDDPWQTAGRTAALSCRLGLTAEVLVLVEDNRDSAARLVDRALDAGTLTGWARALYQAYPHASVAWALAQQVGAHGEARALKLARRIAVAEEERAVRIGAALRGRVADLLFSGVSWWDMCRRASLARAQHGDVESERFVRRCIEIEYEYPRFTYALMQSQTSLRKASAGNVEAGQARRAP